LGKEVALAAMVGEESSQRAATMVVARTARQSTADPQTIDYEE